LQNYVDWRFLREVAWHGLSHVVQQRRAVDD
jgi:hypothetical protein